MKRKQPTATAEHRTHWPDTPENREHLDGIVTRAKYLRHHNKRLRLAKVSRVAKWYEETSKEMRVCFKEQTVKSS